MSELSIEERGELGIPHHKKSEEIQKVIYELDTYGTYSFGGDGDNGEDILYYLDIYFERQEK